MSSKKDNIITSDNYYMGLALELAKENHGLTKENPSVGCVLVKNNQIISTGVTSINGRPHAEYNAVKNCVVSPNGSKDAAEQKTSIFSKNFFLFLTQPNNFIFLCILLFSMKSFKRGPSPAINNFISGNSFKVSIKKFIPFFSCMT